MMSSATLCDMALRAALATSRTDASWLLSSSRSTSTAPAALHCSLNLLLFLASVDSTVVALVRDSVSPVPARTTSISTTPWSSNCRTASGTELRDPRASAAYDAAASPAPRSDMSIAVMDSITLGGRATLGRWAARRPMHMQAAAREASGARGCAATVQRGPMAMLTKWADLDWRSEVLERVRACSADMRRTSWRTCSRRSGIVSALDSYRRM
mmetsp:Transcript_3105/g.7479  ORF Transcript_3105/g.7479 Transcript_3105/m.7479 type:complete len:213 (-) Transcript_3105:229-867(-)